MDKTKSLTPLTYAVACNKETEPPFSGRFLQVGEQGSYLCRRCGFPLWQTSHQFPSHCGWPSFDDRIPHAIQEIPDSDGQRTEIICERCHAHCGHVFRGEGFTTKNQRDCVNSVMLDFVPFLDVKDTEEIILAGGCFWGMDYWFSKAPGVLLVECGYTGGHQPYPCYEDVCNGQTGHFEAIRVVFDNEKTNTKTLYQLFFNIHDATQKNGQGPDIGSQYRSAIFCFDSIQNKVAHELINILKNQSIDVSTQVLPVQIFWSAENHHQHYYQMKKQRPYCHYPRNVF
ncbi:MAG: peptide methionine sulfoxide reductase msrA/msrB [Pseudomonadota bacterium]|nr:peptide methionine sulfoxide reductase msrA/msrB [Pseudomonadota bacterium]